MDLLHKRGAAKLGQIFKLVTRRGEGHDSIELFFESDNAERFNFGDNICVAPNGHLVVCKDQYTDVVDNHLRGVTPRGEVYDLGRLRIQTELAGACFSSDGKWLFLNAHQPSHTLANTGIGRSNLTAYRALESAQCLHGVDDGECRSAERRFSAKRLFP